MIFACEAQELNAALGIVSHSIAVRSPKPILEGVLMESCEEGIRLTCTDMTLGIETVIPAEVSEEGRVVMPGKLFCDAARKLPSGRCEISVNGKWQATVSCRSFRIFRPFRIFSRRDHIPLSALVAFCGCFFRRLFRIFHRRCRI